MAEKKYITDRDFKTAIRFLCEKINVADSKEDVLRYLEDVVIDQDKLWNDIKKNN